MHLIGLLASLYFFFVSIELIAGGFKLFGKDLAHAIMGYTTNPLVSLHRCSRHCTGSVFFIHNLFIGRYGGSRYNSHKACFPVVMGANIGTTVTNMLVSIGHITK